MVKALQKFGLATTVYNASHSGIQHQLTIVNLACFVGEGDNDILIKLN